MVGLENIKSWLSNSVKNHYYFHNCSQSKDWGIYSSEWRNAVVTLSNTVYLICTKEDYLQWRDVWRAVYAKISDESRLSKNNRKYPYPPRTVYAENHANTVETAEYNSQYIGPMHNYYARRLMEMRKLSKEITEKSYNVSHMLEVA